MRIALVGAGNIADRYAEAIVREDSLELAGATDTIPARAEELTASFGGRAYASLDEVLADDSVDAVVNLTSPQAHAEITSSALRAGKHVHSEKPLALTYLDARTLVDLAEEQNLALSCAPSTLLGEAQQTLWKLVRDGAIGRVAIVYAEANWDRLERWHPDPRSLYDVGPHVDVGIYPLSILTAIFGPVFEVHAYGVVLDEHRTLLDGTPFRPGRSDYVAAHLSHRAAVTTRLTANFYVPPSRQRGLELHGDEGSLWLPTWAEANSRVLLQPRGGEYEELELVRKPFDGIDWGRALVDLAEAVRDGRPPRSGAKHAAHLVDVLCTIDRSMSSGERRDVHTTFPQPEPMEWAT